MGIVDRVKRLLGRGEADTDEGMDPDEVARRTRGEDAEAYDRVDRDLERDRNKAYERLTDVDGGRYS